MPDRRAIITTTPEQLMDALGLRGDLLHIEHDHGRQRLELVIAAEDLDPVEPYAEAPVVPAWGLSVRTPHAEAPPQYTVRTTVGGRQVGEVQAIADPFARTTVTVDPEEFGLNDGVPVEVVVHIDGTPAALRHVFAPIDLRPNEPRPDTGPTEGAYVTEVTP